MPSQSMRDVHRINFLEDSHSDLVWVRAANTESALVLSSEDRTVIGRGQTARNAIDMAIRRSTEPAVEVKEKSHKHEAPEVKIGQVWIDNDKRCNGRAVQVQAIQNDGLYDRATVVATIGTIEDGTFKPKHPTRVSKILVSRMKPTSSGYRLMEQAEPVGA